MKTIKELRTEFYNAITSDVTLQGLIGNRLYWINRPTVSDVFPLITQQYFDTSSEYTFDATGVNRVADDIVFQTNIYVDPQEINQMDDIVEQLKVVLNAIGYRNINAPVEFLETDINKVARPMRWERYNV